MNLSYALILFVSSLASIILTLSAWRRRSVPGGGGLTILCAGMTLWMTAYAFYWLFPDSHARLICFNFMYLGVLVVPITLLFFSFRFTNRSQWLKKRLVAVLSIIPVLTLVFLWVEPLRGFFYGKSAPGSLFSGGGVWFWINLIYSYAISAFALALLIQAWFSTIRPLRGQLSAILVGIFFPILLNISLLFGFRPFPGLDLTPFGFIFTCACFAIALTHFRLLDLIPIARSMLIDQMTDGFLVLDAHDRVMDVNRMAQEMLGKTTEGIIGKPADLVFADFPNLFDQYRDTLSLQQEICIATDPPTYLDLHITPLYDRKRNFNGRLVVARDVTDRKKVEQAEHEQRLLAESLRDSSAALNQARSFEEVLDGILDNVGRVVPYDLAAILLSDDDRSARLVRQRGYLENGLEGFINGVRFSYDSLPPLKRMIETGSSLVISDISSEAEWETFEGLEGLGSYVGSPIRIRDIIVGFLDLASFTPGFFTQVHADRLQVFADQAAIAIENARLLEGAQQRAEEFSALLDIGQAATSGLEMDKILKALLEECKQILPIEAFYVATFDNETGMVTYPLFYDQGEIIVLPASDIGQSSLTGRVIKTRKMLYVPDAVSPAAVKKYDIVQFGGAPSRSYVAVPLMVGERVVGVISMQSSQPNAYQPSQIRLLETIATQVAGAIENARLFEEVRLHAEEMTALFDIGITVTSGLEMDQVLRALLEKCRQVLPVEAFYVAILDSESGLIRHPLAFDLGEYPQIPTRDIRENPGLSGYIINTRQTLYIPDMLAPDAIKTFQIFRTSGTPTRAFVGVPMIVGEQIVGVISMQSYQPNAYDPGQIRLLETIATQAAVAIENSRLYAKAQQEILEREKAERRYRALFEQSHDAVFIIGFDGQQWEVNQRAMDLLGYAEDEIRSLYVNDISAQPEESGSILDRLLAGEHIPLYERTFRKKNGKDIWVEINAEMVRAADGTPLHIQSVVRDITQRKQSERALHDANEQLRLQLSENKKLQAQLREQVIRDPLTGLFNRRYLEEALEREFSLAKRQATPVCLVMMDIDGFKGFNDTYGHDAGDFLLKKLGELLVTEVRRSDISCRYGGEEFLIVMPGVPLDKGHERAERLRKVFGSGKFQHMGVKLNATISLGVAVYPDNGQNWEEVLHAADRAMYAAKAAGKNRVRSAGS
jgi:diguanylate cyclase (GGDEF)-like protein/PAS domain S-box-containing protein